MKRYPIIIEPEFRALVPPMSADSLAQFLNFVLSQFKAVSCG